MAELTMDYDIGGFFDEMYSHPNEVRLPYTGVQEKILSLGLDELKRRKTAAERSMFGMGITFNVYSAGSNKEQIFPFDIIPRIIDRKEWDKLERGLMQRSRALNLFLSDIYSEQKILKDGIIPTEIIRSAKGYLPQCQGLLPPLGIWSHINGTDLVRGTDGAYYVLEDNLRCASGVSYGLENRENMKRMFPDLFRRLGVRPVYDYPQRLLEMLRSISPVPNPSVVLLTPGQFNSAYFEHSFLAREMGVELVEGRDLLVEDGFVWMRTTSGLKRVDVIYRRIDDTFLDPDVFRADSMLGVKGLFEAYVKGHVAIANAPGTGVADDKVIYAYVPRMIRYYLGEDEIIPNVPTYVCEEEKDRKFVIDNIHTLVVKAANEAGGYGMLIGPHSSRADQDKFKDLIRANPRNYIAQPTISLSRVPTIAGDGIEGRHVDLRPFILSGKSVYVLPRGLTRVALRNGCLGRTSSPGGGSKDTWVLG